MRLAVAVPLTGDMGTEGQGVRRAVELAVEEANASGRFPFPLEVSAFDDRADPREAVNVAHLIVSNPRVAAVIGHLNSGCALEAARVYAGAPVAMISPSATNPEITLQQARADWDGPKVAFRVVPTDAVQGAFAARFVRQRLRLRKVSVLHDRTPYGKGLAERFGTEFAALGGSVVSVDGLPPGEKDHRPVLERLKAKQAPEGLYFGGDYTGAGVLAAQMREVGLKTPLISGDGARSPALFEVAGDAADGMYLTMVGVPVELLATARDFAARYRARWTGPDEDLRPFDHFAYEAASIALDAIAAAGPERAKVLEAVRRTRRTGILGPVAFDAMGDTQNRAVTMTRADAAKRAFPPAP